MNTLDKLTVLARGRKKKGKSAGSGRAAMLRVVMPLLSGDKGDALAAAVNGGDPDKAKALWSQAGDDLYQAVEMIRDQKLAKSKPKPSKDLPIKQKADDNATE